MLLAAIAAGGALGAALRHLVAGAVMRAVGLSFPYGTLTVNVLGSLIMGLLVGLLVARMDLGPVTRGFLTTGVLGGFTTFSAFSLEMALFIERQQAGLAALYALLSIGLCTAAVFAGLWIGRA